jgi:hypothetical protein
MFQNDAAKSGILCVSVITDPALPAPVLRRRSVLKSGASRRALLTVQAAMSVGITLVGPLHAAHAQTSLPSTNNTVVLSHYGVGDNPFTISNNTLISTDFNGVYGSSGRYTLSNSGTVISSQADGILLKGGGTINNAGTVHGAATGAYGGIIMAGRVSTLINSGIITGNIGAEISHGGYINNSGSIGGGMVGAFVNSHAGNVYNSGLITGDTAVQLNAGGFVDNGNSIIGGTIGIDISGGTGVVNNWSAGANVITGGSYAVDISSANGTLITRGYVYGWGNGLGNAAVKMNGGYIYNKPSISGAEPAGLIIGNNYGVLGTGDNALRIRNDGTVAGFIDGITLGQAGGTVTNGAGSYIEGFQYAGINASSGSLHVSNDGTIVGGQYGINAFTGYQAGQLGGVTVGNTGTIYGGHTGIYVNTGFGSVTNSGSIIGGRDSGVALETGGYVSNTGSIIGGGVGVYVGGSFGVVHNNGAWDQANYISGTYAGVVIGAPNGTLITRGLITESAGGYQNAAVIMNGGSIYNQASAWHRGVISGYANGVIAFGTNAINIVNNGTIQGIGYDTVGGTWTNGIVLGSGGGQITNYASAVISGAFGNGILSNYGSFSVENAGLIYGYHDGIDVYHIGTIGGFGGVTIANSGGVIGNDTGIYVSTGYADITNTGLIAGNNDEGIYTNAGASINNSGSIFGGGTGVLAYGGLSLTNSGTIEGNVSGVYVGSGAATIHNSGTIIGFDQEGIGLLGGGSISNSGSILGYTNGIYADDLPVTVNNIGLILGVGPYASGIDARAGATVYNWSGGTIAGLSSGVYIEGGYGAVFNHGVIMGKTYAGVGIYDNGTVANFGGSISGYSGVVFGYAGNVTLSTGRVFNSGTIIGNSFAGVAMYDGGAVLNDWSGTIAALAATGPGIVMYGAPGTVANYGVVLGGNLGNGVDLDAGGVVYNAGSIYGGTGVKIGTTLARVINAGLINGGTTGVDLQDGGYVRNDWYANCNLHIGTIYGGSVGVQIDTTFGLVTNMGTIAAGRFTNYGVGVLLGDGGLVGNGDFTYANTLHIGIIGGGGIGVEALNAPAGVFNEGVIVGSFAGVALMDGGGVANYIYHTTIDSAPVSFAGTIIGDNFGVYASSLATATVFNAGFISGIDAGVDLLGGGSVANATDGVIFGQGYGVRIGTLPGYVNNAGWIAGWGHDGVYLVKGGEVVNQNSGLVIGINHGIVIGDSPADSLAAPGVVLNSGQVYASCGTGLVMNTGGYLNNSSTGLIHNWLFGSGVYLYANPTIANAISNAGSIFGVFDGVNVYGNGLFTLLNTGTITGGEGVYIHAGTVGTDVVMNTGSIQGFNDSGVILRGDGAFYLGNSSTGTIIGAGGSSGIEVEADMANIVNAGTIYGGRYGVYGDNTSLHVTNLQSGTISGYTDEGVYTDGGQLSVDNAGQILSADYEGIGAYDGSLAIILNESTGTIYGYDYGLDLENAHNMVDNRGLVTSTADEAVYVDGTLSQILNEANGTIAGGDYGIYAEADTFALDNAGLITANADDAVYSYYTSSVINEASGTIIAPEYAVWLEGDYGTLQNAGLLEGDYAVVMQNTLGSVLNTRSGVITGAREGVYTEYGENVTNAGQITGLNYIGVQLDNGGQLNNSGAIFGGEFGVADYGGTGGGSVSNSITIFNSGLIDGNEGGVLLYPVTSDEIVNETNGRITGGTYGVWIGYSGSTAAVAGTVFNAGTIDGGTTGIYLYNGGSVTNFKGGIIAGGQYGIQAGYVGNTLANIATIENAGVISGGTDAILLTQGGVVGNSATGTITGGTFGIDAPGIANVFNAGVITGGATAIGLGAGGTVTNTGSISGGTDGIVFTAGDPAFVDNAGRITGTTGVGIQLEGGTLINRSTGVIQGGAEGVIAQNGATIVNAGKIEDSPAPHHAGVVLYGQTSLTNLPTGTISGATGVLVSGNQATIVDEGAIISTDGGDAIQILPTADPAQITLTSGSRLTGTIDGGGTAGTITLTGQNTLGNTIANFGAGSSLTVAPGATWTGLGNWTIANVNNTGTFQGGTLTTPLNVKGNFMSSGTLQVVVTPTISTHLNVTGTATFSGALTYIFAPGIYTPGYKYNFVTAAGGASGKFTTVDYLGATPGYVSKTTSVVITGDTLGSNLVLGRVAPLDDSIFSDANQDAALNAQAANDSLLGKASGDEDANAAACAAATQVMPGRTDVHGSNLASKMTQAVANAFCGAGGWIEATGSTMTIDNSGGVSGYTGNDAGFLAGLDRPVGDLGTRLGLAVGYDNAWLDDKAHGKASADTVRVGLYAAQPIGRFTIAADMMYGAASNTSTRETGIGAASGKSNGNVYNGGVQVSTGLNVNGLSITPAAGIKFADVSNGGFSETAPNGLAAFAVSPQTSSYTSIQPYLDIGMSKSFTTESLVTITPSVIVGYQLEAGDRSKSVDVTTLDKALFAGGHTNLDAGGAKIGASIVAGKNNWSLYAKYDATLAGNYTAQAGEAGLQIRF